MQFMPDLLRLRLHWAVLGRARRPEPDAQWQSGRGHLWWFVAAARGSPGRGTEQGTYWYRDRYYSYLVLPLAVQAGGSRQVDNPRRGFETGWELEPGDSSVPGPWLGLMPMLVGIGPLGLAEVSL